MLDKKWMTGINGEAIKGRQGWVLGTAVKDPFGKLTFHIRVSE